MRDWVFRVDHETCTSPFLARCPLSRAKEKSILGSQKLIQVGSSLSADGVQPELHFKCTKMCPSVVAKKPCHSRSFDVEEQKPTPGGQGGRLSRRRGSALEQFRLAHLHRVNPPSSQKIAT